MLLNIIGYGYLTVGWASLLLAGIAVYEYERDCEEEWPDGDEWDRARDADIDRQMEDAA